MSNETINSIVSDEKREDYLNKHPWMREYPYIRSFLKSRISHSGYAWRFNTIEKQQSYLYMTIMNLESLINTTDISVLNAVLVTLRFTIQESGYFFVYQSDLKSILEWRIKQLESTKVASVIEHSKDGAGEVLSKS